jgi:DNA replication protein DnaC
MIERLKKQTKELRLPYMNKNIEEHIKQANIENSSYEEFLTNILDYEIELRRNNSTKKRIQTAKFPYKKYLDEIDIASLPDGVKSHYKNICSLDFIKDRQNIILAGNPGTGKSHISIGLGIKACMEGYNVYYAHVPNMIIELKEAKNERVLNRLKKKFQKYDLIILDELGYISFDKEGAELLFNFISSRSEIKSTIITTNLSFDRWKEIFHDPVITAAIVDRITHKSYVINMNGNSYRMKQTKEFLLSKTQNKSSD